MEIKKLYLYDKKYISLDKISKMSSGILNLPKNYKSFGTFPFLDYLTVYNKGTIFETKNLKKINIFEHDLNKFFISHKNQIIGTWSSENNNDIFMTCYVKTKDKFILNGFCKSFEIIDDNFHPKWVSFYINFSKKINHLRKSIPFTTRCNMTKTIIKWFMIPCISLSDQQQIINIIEPFEKIHNNVLNKLDFSKKIYSIIINKKYDSKIMINDSISFKKGVDLKKIKFTNNIGIPFINVSAINGNTNKYIDNEFSELINIEYGDVMLSLDATIGIVNNFLYGINGYGYKVESNKYKNYEIYFSLLNKTNQNIMKIYSYGTTILHGSESKKHLLIFNFDLNKIFLEKVYLFEIKLKKISLYLKRIINNLIMLYVK